MTPELVGFVAAHGVLFAAIIARRVFRQMMGA